MLLDEFTVKEAAAVTPNFTSVVPVKFEPTIVTIVPLTPTIGEKEVIIGPLKINPGRVAVPLFVVMLTSPLAPAPTIAVMPVAESTVNNAAFTPPNLTAVAPGKFVP